MDGLHSLLFWANPAPENRVPLDFSNLYLLALPFPTLLLQVHLLLRYPLTSLNRLLRILLIFPSIILASRAGFGHRFKLNDEQGSTLQAYNVALGVYVAFAAAKTIEWGLMNQRPRLRGSGKKKGVVSADSAPSIQNGSSSQIKIDSNQNRNPSTTSRSRTSSSVSKTNTTSSTSKPSDELLPLLFPGSWVPLELDLLASMRGLGWEFGIDSKAGYGRKTWTLEQRMNFIWGRVGNSLVGIFSMDLLDSLMKHPRINPAGRVGGGSLWESEAGILGKAGPPALTMLLGFVVYAAIQGVYSILSVICVLMGSSPDYFTPLPFSRPWAATSLRRLWAFHWHSLFRRSFLFLGYFPTRRTTSRFGRNASKIMATLSVFLISGLLHESGSWGLVRSFPFDDDRMWGRTTLFFLLQGVGTIAEEAWENSTGWKVTGIEGYIWTYSWMTLTGMLASDVWFSFGIAASHCTLGMSGYLIDGLVEIVEGSRSG